jgi:hypothetical protein
VLCIVLKTAGYLLYVFHCDWVKPPTRVIGNMQCYFTSRFGPVTSSHLPLGK